MSDTIPDYIYQRSRRNWTLDELSVKHEGHDASGRSVNWSTVMAWAAEGIIPFITDPAEANGFTVEQLRSMGHRGIVLAIPESSEQPE